MIPTKRSVKKYSFKSPNLTRLRELGSLVTSPGGFRDRHGRLLDILKIKVEKGILETLVQFYDPAYHCFTFSYYQLVPTLEEYSYWVGLPVPDKEPFNGLKPTPKTSTIIEALHLKPSDMVPPNFIIKGDFQGLTANFLCKKASAFAKEKKSVPLNLSSPYSYMALYSSLTLTTLLTSMPSKSSYPKILSLPYSRTHTIPSTIELSKRTKLSFAVYLYYTSGLLRIYPNPSSPKQTQENPFGLKESCPLPQTTLFGTMQPMTLE